MGSDCQMAPLTRLRDLVRVTGKGLCRGIEATQGGTLVFVGDAQLIKQSPVMGGGWSGVGELAHSSCQLSPPCLQTPSWGWEEESEKREIQGLRAKPPLIFIAGELEICLSLPILGR